MILEINNLITIELKAGIKSTTGDELQSDYTSYFTTEMSPMYGSAAGVRRLVGAHAEGISDDIINQIILEYSVIAQDLGDCTIDSRWQRYTEVWVTYKAALIILYNTEEFKQSGSGKLFKQLGDFSISTGGPPTDKAGLVKLIDWLECQAFKYEIAVRYCSQPAINCEGLTNTAAIPYTPKLPGIVERGLYDINKAYTGRRWVAVRGEPRGNNTLFTFGKKYKTNLERIYSNYESLFY